MLGDIDLFERAAFMQNEHAAINRRLSDPDFQALLLSRAIGLALGSSLMATAFVVHDVYLWTHPPTPKYFVIDGRKAREMTALDTPIVDDAQLLDWSTRAALAPYNINYNDYPQQLSAASRRFSKRGWNSFATSVMDTKNFETMKRSMLLCYAQAQRAAVISDVATISGSLAYRIQVPIVQTCQNSNQNITQNLVIKALVTRTNAEDRPDGLEIDELVAVRQ